MLIFLLASLFSQTIYEMDEVVVTANRYPVQLEDAAVAVMIIERAEIAQLKALSLDEVLSAVAGIDFKDYGTGGGVTSVSIRGIPSNGTLVLLNGQPLNAVTNGMADVSTIDVNTIERIEIVRGPVSSIYGANALGGVVNIITIRELSRPEVRLQFTPSTADLDAPFQTHNAFIKFGLPVGNTQYNLAGAYTHDPGLRNNSNLKKYHTTASIFHNTDRFITRASVCYDERRYGIPGPLPRIDSLHPAPQFGDSTATSLFDREQDRSLLGNLDLELGITDNIRWYNKLFANRNEIRYHTTYGMSNDTINEDYDYLIHTLGLNTMITVRKAVLDYTTGVDAHYDTLRAQKLSPDTGDTIWQASAYNIGAWGELRLRISDRISVTPSIRYDHNSGFGGFLSPGIGIVSILRPDLWLKFTVGKTFRAPTFNDLYWPKYGNPNLRPEHGWAYELRVENSPLPSLFAALSLFSRNSQDRITWLPLESDLWQPQNVDILEVAGLDLEIKHYIRGFMEYAIDATYLRARQKNDEIIYSYYDWVADTSLTIIQEIERKAAFTPSFSISSRFNFRLPEEIELNISGQYVSRRVNYYPNYDDYPHVFMDAKYLKSYFVINTALTKTLLNHLTMTAGVKNILDTDYALQFGNTMDDRDYPMAGRIYFLQLSVHY
jgi:outer membrane cobalamin receptor